MNGTRLSAFFKLSMRHFKYDFPASIVVFLIALPLCLGIALASGAPLFAGLLTGVVGGIVVASISGSSLSVSGPAAGLTVIVLGAIQGLGDFRIFLLALFLAGIIQLILGIVKAGAIGNYFPSNVITGMLAAIGISIILQQIPVALGISGSIDMATLGEHLNIPALAICIVSVAILLLWPKIPKVNRIPAPLVVVGTGILAVVLLAGTPYALLPKQLVQIPEIGSFKALLALLLTPDFTHIGDKSVWIVAFTIAIVASLETLLNLDAVDKLDVQKRVSPTNRELIAQGIGNMSCGLIGGLPLTSVIVRSSANTYAGAKTRQSAILHGIWILLSILFLSPVINYIPLACLAAILITTGYKLASVALFKRMFQHKPVQYIPFVTTIIAILLTDLLVGVGVGLAVSVLFLLRNNMRNSFDYQEHKEETDHRIVVRLSEEVSFLNKAPIRRSLNTIPRKVNTVVIDGRNSRFIDKDVLLLIEEYEITAKKQGKNVQLLEVYDK